MGRPFVTFVFPVFGDIAGGGVENTEAGSSGDGHVLQQPKLVGVGSGDIIIAQRFPLVTPNQRCICREQLGAMILVGITDTAPGAADIDRFRCVAQDTVQLFIIQAAYQPFNLTGSVQNFSPSLRKRARMLSCSLPILFMEKTSLSLIICAYAFCAGENPARNTPPRFLRGERSEAARWFQPDGSVRRSARK